MSEGSRRSRVTVTLGRSGRVVQRAGGSSDDGVRNGVAAAGSKRSIRDRLGGGFDDRGELYNKRARGGSSSNSIDMCLDEDDLRFKLMQKNMSLDYRGSSLRNVDLRDKLLSKTSRASADSMSLRPPESAASAWHPVRDPRISGINRQPVLESRDNSLLGRFPLSRNPGNLSTMGPPRSVSSWTLDNLRRRSPDTFQRRSPDPLRRRSPDTLRRPLRSPDSLRRPLRSPDIMRRPLRSPDTLRRPLRSPDTMRRPLRSPDTLRRPLRSPDTLRRPLRSPDTLRRPLRSPDNLRRPLRSPDTLRIPLRSPDTLRRPLRSPDTLRRPLRSPDTLTRPLRSPDTLRRPLRSPEILRRRSPDSFRRGSPEDFRRRSPDRLLRSSAARPISPERNREVLQRRPPMRPYDDGRPRSYMRISSTRVVRPSPLLAQSSVSVAPVKSMAPVSQHYPRVRGILQNIPSTIDEPPTVDGLLQSLGLEKFAIHFKAEEVDMNALRQLGDSDLKDLGIPMGPRKKILQAVMSRPRRQL